MRDEERKKETIRCSGEAGNPALLGHNPEIRKW